MLEKLQTATLAVLYFWFGGFIALLVNIAVFTLFTYLPNHREGAAFLSFVAAALPLGILVSAIAGKEGDDWYQYVGKVFFHPQKTFCYMRRLAPYQMGAADWRAASNAIGLFPYQIITFYYLVISGKNVTEAFAWSLAVLTAILLVAALLPNKEPLIAKKA
jgi:hypothetical protein